MKNIFIITMVLCFFFAISALGEQPQTDQSTPDNGPASQRDLYRKKLHDRVFMMMAWELADEMKLPAEQEMKFLNTMREHFKQKGELVHQQAEAMKSLKENYKKDAKSSPEIQANLKKLEELKENEQKLDNTLNTRLKEILSVEQQAHFTVVWPQVQERIKKQLLAQKERRMVKQNAMKGKKAKQMGTEPQPGPSK